MKILILGGNGFIGSHLTDALLAKGNRIRVLDRKYNPYSPPHPQVDYRIANLSDSASIAEALQNIDVVYHLISTSVPSTSNLDPVADIECNLVSTVKLLQQMVNLDVRKIVFLSSGGTVYGNPTEEPVPETHALNPICSYGVVKVAIEKYLLMFQKLYGIQPIILRPSNPFGARQGHIGVQGVIPTFLKRIIDGDPIQIWGDGTIVRDYIYISDLVDFCVCAGSSEHTGIFNVGSGQGTSLNEIVQMIIQVVGKDIDVEHHPGRAFDVQQIILDIRKALEVYDWRPAISIENGIQQHWQWLRQISNQCG